MPLRPHWKGYLKLSLVSCPIALVPAISAAERVSFRQVNRQTGHRLRQQLVDALTGDVLERQDKARGYEVGHQEHLIVEDQEIEQARQEARASRSAPPSQPTINESAAAQSRAAVSKRAAKALEEEAPPIQPELLPMRVENTRTVEIERFIPREQL